jgi:beta-galactosidase/beta-glucuronidase
MGRFEENALIEAHYLTMKKTLLLTISLACFLCSYTQQISLAGDWAFAIDRNDIGVNEKWFSKKLEDKIHLPGSMNENGKGDDVTLDTKWTGSIYDSSFFFQPRLAKYRQPGNEKNSVLVNTA